MKIAWYFIFLALSVVASFLSRLSLSTVKEAILWLREAEAEAVVE